MKFSIITPVYNREDCVSRCIESVLRQSLTNVIGGGYEHILVDDGSTDLTAKICEGYAKNNPSVRFIRFEQNRGTNAARNAAIAAAKGEWCIILDSDDYFVENALEAISHTIASRPGFLHYTFAAEDMDYNNDFYRNCDEKVVGYSDFLHHNVRSDFIHCIATTTLRKYPFDESVRIHEGVFFLAFYREAQRVLFTNKVITIRERGRSDSVTLDCVRTKRVLIERGVKANELMLAGYGNDMKRFGCTDTLKYLYAYLFDNYLLLGEYAKIKQLNNKFASDYLHCIPQTRKIHILNTIYRLRLRYVYWFLLRSYLLLKYKVFRYKIK